MSSGIKLVQWEPRQVYAQPAYGAKGRPHLLINLDLIHTIYVGEDLTITAESEQIQPLGTMGIDGNRDVYASTLGLATVCKLQLSPNTNNWQPSPSQITAKTPINLGPLGNIGPGNTKMVGTFDFKQPGYEIVIGLSINAASASPFAQVIFTWLDSVSGLIVKRQRWTVAAGSGQGNTYFTSGSGPTRGDKLQVQIFNSDNTFFMNLDALVINQTSTGVGVIQDEWFGISEDDGILVPGFVGPSTMLASGLLAQTSLNVGTGAGNAITRLMPLFYGRVRFMVMQASSITNATLTFQSQDPLFPATIYSAGIGNQLNVGPQEITLPRAPCTFTYQNNSAGSGQFTISVITLESVVGG